MPSKSPQQHRFMEAAAHNPEFAKKAGIPQNVAKEFVAADEKAATKKIQAAEVRTQTGLKRALLKLDRPPSAEPPHPPQCSAGWC